MKKVKLLLLTAVLLLSLLQSCSSMFGGGVSNIVASSYLSEDSDLLAAEGIFLARRTVAKYRIELGIGSSTARRARNRGK